VSVESHDEDSRDDDLQDALGALKSMLVPGETLLASAAQRRVFALSHRRVLIAATTGRLLAIERGLIGGFVPTDVRWQDLKNVQIKAGIFGSDLIIGALSRPDIVKEGTDVTLIFEGLRKDEAQAVYRICQAQEQAWREKRRLRELEEMRAQSGSFVTASGADAASSNAQEMPDPIERLRRARGLLDEGLISDSEYETVKARIVGQI
jgi:hypothetical protein